MSTLSRLVGLYADRAARRQVYRLLVRAKFLRAQFACYDITMITRDEILKRRGDITRLAARWGAHNVRIFGSVARCDTTETSDLDLLVRFDPGRTLLDHGGLLMDLRELVGVKVDVISEGALDGRFGEIVRREAVSL